MSKIRCKFPKCRAFLPATASCFVLEIRTEDSLYPTGMYKNPVIGWGVDEDVYVLYPLTLNGMKYENEAILCPDGHVEIPMVAWFEDVDEWLEYHQLEFFEKTGVKPENTKKLSHNLHSTFGQSLNAAHWKA